MVEYRLFGANAGPGRSNRAPIWLADRKVAESIVGSGLNDLAVEQRSGPPRWGICAGSNIHVWIYVIDDVGTSVIAIDFDARTKSHDRAIDGGKVRNHGTKFRIREADLKRLYCHMKEFGDG